MNSEDQAYSKQQDETNLEAISLIAKKRREDVILEASKPPPDFLLSVMQCEVAYTIVPTMLPFSYMDFQAFEKALFDKYGLRFDRPTLGPEALKMLSADEQITSGQISDMLAERAGTDSLKFRGGRFTVGRDDVVPIKGINLNRETVHVSVEGSSNVAELIVKEVTEDLWASAGTPKRWDSIKVAVQMMHYGTATKVNIGVPLERFLSTQFSGFIGAEMVDGSRYAAGMISRSARDDFRPPPESVVTWTVDDITLHMYVFNKKNGRSESCDFRITVASRDEQGTGIFTIVSELPFTEHIACIAKMKEYLTGKN